MLSHLSLGDPWLVGECTKKENETVRIKDEETKILGITKEVNLGTRGLL
jgi:hypothetical protein